MSSYKDKNIDRDELIRIIPTISEQVFGEKVTVSIDDQTQSKMVRIYSDTKECKIQLFFNKKGTTTVNPDVGQNKDLSNLIAPILIDETQIDERSTFSFSVPNIATEDFDFLISYLCEDDKAKIICDEETAIYRLIRLHGSNDDTLVIKKYKNGTTQFQGRPITLYKNVSYFLSNICNASDIIKTQEQFYKIEINPSGIEQEYDALFSKSKDFLGDTIKEMILPTFALRRVEVELTDYTLFVFPVLRGLEGYIKKLFLSKGIVINRDGFGDHFMFVSGERLMRLSCKPRQKVNCEKTCKALEDSYDHLRINRNSLFHVDGMVEPSRVLETRAQAEELFIKTVEIIEFTYASLV